MERNKKIALYLVSALSVTLAATGCAEEKTVTADCVKRGTNEVVSDRECKSGGSSFVWIYGGTVYNGTGTTGGRRYVKGGSSVMPPKTNINTRSGTTLRGGFGSSSKGGSGS